MIHFFPKGSTSSLRSPGPWSNSGLRMSPPEWFRQALKVSIQTFQQTHYRRVLVCSTTTIHPRPVFLLPKVHPNDLLMVTLVNFSRNFPYSGPNEEMVQSNRNPFEPFTFRYDVTRKNTTQVQVRGQHLIWRSAVMTRVLSAKFMFSLWTRESS